MFIVLFTIIIGSVMIFVRYREYKTNKETVTNAITNRKFEIFDYSKGVRIFYYCVILIGIVSCGYGIAIQNFETIAMGAIIAMLFISELLNVPYKYVLYYNDSQFITNGKVLRIKSIKYFERILNVKFFFIKVFMMNGDKYSVSPKAYEILDQKLTEVRKKKDNRIEANH